MSIRVIRSAGNPLEEGGCFAILNGNLAPRGAVVKKTGEDVREFLLNRTVKPGSVLVVRYEGPKGGPGNAGGVPENGRQRRRRRHLAVTGAEPAERPR